MPYEELDGELKEAEDRRSKGVNLQCRFLNKTRVLWLPGGRYVTDFNNENIACLRDKLDNRRMFGSLGKPLGPPHHSRILVQLSVKFYTKANGPFFTPFNVLAVCSHSASTDLSTKWARIRHRVYMTLDPNINHISRATRFPCKKIASDCYKRQPARVCSLESKSLKTIASHCYKRQVETAIPDKISTQLRAYVTGAILASTSLLP
ncbi:hypothetical protein J6590_044008 [Homalodisca vitripennis]|nr:hypothetical protein J6590_044008 [Homalodisca vitripennis]